MAERSGGLLSASVMVVLTLGGSACDYDRSSAPNGQGYGDTAGMSAVRGRSDFRVFTATGDIAATVAEFRTALGDPLNGGTPGPLSGGRREIKWDGAPAEMPGDFFNTVVTAGAIFSTGGTGFRNSDSDFSEINPAYADDFNAFSLPKTFMPIGSAVVTTEFRVPGLQTPAATRGFGVVFSDVERQGRHPSSSSTPMAGVSASTTHRSGAMHPGSLSSASCSIRRWWRRSGSRRASGRSAPTCRI